MVENKKPDCHEHSVPDDIEQEIEVFHDERRMSVYCSNGTMFLNKVVYRELKYCPVCGKKLI